MSNRSGSARPETADRTAGRYPVIETREIAANDVLAVLIKDKTSDRSLILVNSAHAPAETDLAVAALRAELEGAP